MTFNTSDGYTIVCKDEWIRNRYVNFIQYDLYILLTEHNLGQFLHNKDGPAISKGDIKSYFLNGVALTYEQAVASIPEVHRSAFNNILKDILE